MPFTYCEFIKYKDKLKVIQILERIKSAYSLKTDAEVANFLDIKPSTLSMQKNRGRLNLERIIKKCSDLNRNWLLDGEGPKKKEDIVNGVKGIEIYSSIHFANSGEPDFAESAKAGNLFVETNKKWSPVSAAERTVGYVISGNEMAPTLENDDIAIFNLDNTTPNGQSIFLLSIDNSVVCRRVETNSDHHKIYGDNSGSQEIEVSANGSNYQILGELIWVMRSL
jgi:phage repressor protein C with HTH and peptisase S24 domain